jgi:transcriptional regulator with XRE-family HTH domain
METSTRQMRLKRLREAAGLSQYQLSAISGIARNRLSLFECGYVQLKDEEYGAAEHAIRDVLLEKRQHLSTALSDSRTAATA